VSARPPWTDPIIRVQITSAQATDRPRVTQFLTKMDHNGLYQRHFSHGEAPNLDLMRRIDMLGYADRHAVLAVGANGDVLGHGEYVAENGEAEFALMVLPLFRGLGIGARLLRAMLDHARMAGLRRLHGMIQASNAPTLRLVLRHGFAVVPGADHRVVLVSCKIETNVETKFFSQSNTANAPVPLIRNDPDRTPLHRRIGPRAPFWPRGGQVQRVSADAVGGGQEA
jgi:GNAT superfamily N-acetyltransferase